MRRRELLLASGALLGTSLAWSQPVRRRARIAMFLIDALAEMREFVQIVQARLATHGFVEGRNLHVDVHAFHGLNEVSVSGIRGRLEPKPDAILSFTSSLTRFVQQAAGSLPIVFALVGDAVAFGLVKDYARPGGNTTGTSWRQIEMTLKRLELIREMLPAAKRIVFAGYLADVTFRAGESTIRGAATRLGLDLIDADGREGLSRTAQAAMQQGADAVFLFQPITYLGQRSVARALIEEATERGLPVFVAESELVESGGLLSYGPDSREQLNQAADQLAQILHGKHPADVPVYLSDRFAVTVNQKAARRLGIRVPQSILLRADRVIE